MYLLTKYIVMLTFQQCRHMETSQLLYTAIGWFLYNGHSMVVNELMGCLFNASVGNIYF